jgi:DNA-binding NarL/FixJ family response regulator
MKGFVETTLIIAAADAESLEAIRRLAEQIQGVRIVTETASVPADARRAPLTGLDVEMLKLTVRGKSDKEMATALDMPVRTVEKRKARLRRKLGVNSTVELAVYAVMQRLVTTETL